MPTTSASKTTTERRGGTGSGALRVRPVSATKSRDVRASIPRDPASLGPMVHPGEMLNEEFIKPMELQQTVLAEELGISKNRLNELIAGKRGMTADTAIRLQERFGWPARIWMHLQADYDLQTALKARKSPARR